MVVGFSVFMVGLSIGLYYAGISMGYLYLLMGVIVSAAVLPAALTLLWSKMNVYAATISPILGFFCAIISWLVYTKKTYGELTVETTGSNNPMLIGNVVALLSPCIFIPVLTYAIGPDNYDYESMRAIRKADDAEIAREANVELSRVPGEGDRNEEEETRKLNRAAKIARILTVTMTLIFLVIWPFPLYGTGYIFSKTFFTGWISVGIAWLFFSSAVVGLYPIFESRSTIIRTTKGIIRDLTGKGSTPAIDGEEASTTSGDEVVAEKVMVDKA